jgi:GDPmannose 4,6-dehydratase
VRELTKVAFEHAELDMEKHIVGDPQFLRPAEVNHLVGDSSNARAQLGWSPKTSFRELVELMVDADLERLTSAADRRELA